jgi:hypothetical protein
MTLPANVRVNTSVPFPSLVKASGPITLAKASGIWTVGFNISNLGTQVPPSQNFPSDYLIVYDAVAGTFFKMSITALANSIISGGRTQRSITSSGQLPLASNDSILNLNAATDLTPIVPLASSRNGMPFTFKNLPGSHVQTLTKTGSDTFDGLTTIPLAAGAAVTLMPYNDSVNSGYAIE